MKKGFLLLGLIFAFSTLVTHAQIYEYYSQDFEVGTPVTYTVSSSTAIVPQSTIVSGGSRSLKMTHTQSLCESRMWTRIRDRRVSRVTCAILR